MRPLYLHQLAFTLAIESVEQFEAFLKHAQKERYFGVEVCWPLFSGVTPQEAAGLLKKYGLGLAFCTFNGENDPLEDSKQADAVVLELDSAASYLADLRSEGVKSAQYITGPFAKKIGHTYERGDALRQKVIDFITRVVLEVAEPHDCFVCEEPLRGTEQACRIAALEDGAVTTVEEALIIWKAVREKTGLERNFIHVDMYHMATNGEDLPKWIGEAARAGAIGWFHAGGDLGRAPMTKTPKGGYTWAEVKEALAPYQGHVCIELFCQEVREGIPGLGDGLEPATESDNEITHETLVEEGICEYSEAA